MTWLGWSDQPIGSLGPWSNKNLKPNIGQQKNINAKTKNACPGWMMNNI
jgi:hypothetical protein